MNPTRPPSTPDAAVIALLCRVADALEVQAATLVRIEAAVSRRKNRLSRADELLLAQLLPAVEGVRGWCTWSAAALLRDAESDEDLRVALGEMNARSLGKLLHRAHDAEIPGWRVERCNRVAEGWEWKAERCS